MHAIVKPAIVLGIAAALALGSMTPSQARVRPKPAAGVGLATGAAVASAPAANAYRYGYDYGPGYEAYGYAPPAAPTDRYDQPVHGYDTNYVGPWRERQLEGRDY